MKIMFTITALILSKMNEEKMKELECGKEYHFFDDGKTSPSRHYICRCERIITPEEAKSIIFDIDDIGNMTLYDIWVNQSRNVDWLFAEHTDFFAEISCPNYDENNLWAVRTKDGGWFTLDIQSYWQGGRIDINGDIFENVIEFWEKEGDKEIVQQYMNEKYE